MLDSDLIKFLAENIGRLEPFDYFLILLMGVLIGLGAYFLVRSIYRQVIAAHEKLIIIKDKTIEHQEKTLLSLAAQRAELEKANSRVEQELEKIRGDLQTQSEKNNQQVNDLVKRVRILIRLVMLARTGLLQLNILHLYRVRAGVMAPYARFVHDAEFRSPTNITQGVDDLMDKLFHVLEIVAIEGDDAGSPIKWPDAVPDAVFQLVAGDISRSRLVLEQDLNKAKPIIFEQMKKLAEQFQAKTLK